MKKTLFTIALPEEKICLPESDDIKVVVTKVGKACSGFRTFVNHQFHRRRKTG